jgi:hypothetical protein
MGIGAAKSMPRDHVKPVVIGTYLEIFGVIGRLRRVVPQLAAK